MAQVPCNGVISNGDINVDTDKALGRNDAGGPPPGPKLCYFHHESVRDADKGVDPSQPCCGIQDSTCPKPYTSTPMACQLDFVWLPARAPHVDPQHVWRA